MRSQVVYNISNPKLLSRAGPTIQQPLFRVIQALRIDKVNIDDNELVYCRAENDVGKASAQLPINILCKLFHFFDCLPLLLLFPSRPSHRVAGIS